MNKKQTRAESRFQGDQIEVIRFVLHVMEDKENSIINLQRHENNWTVQLDKKPGDKNKPQTRAGLFDMGW